MPIIQPYPDLGIHCSYVQATKSESGIKAGVKDNTPTKEHYGNMIEVYQNIIVPVCQYFSVDPLINSFYRNVLTNKAVGGSSTSLHLFGQAVDLDYDRVKGCEGWNMELYEFIKNELSFHELIFEFSNKDTSPQWVHAGFISEARNKRVIKRAIRDKRGKVSYLII